MPIRDGVCVCVLVLYSNFINDNCVSRTCQVTLLAEATLYIDIFLRNLFCVCKVMERVLGQ